MKFDDLTPEHIEAIKKNFRTVIERALHLTPNTRLKEVRVVREGVSVTISPVFDPDLTQYEASLLQEAVVQASAKIGVKTPDFVGSGYNWNQPKVDVTAELMKARGNDEAKVYDNLAMDMLLLLQGAAMKFLEDRVSENSDPAAVTVLLSEVFATRAFGYLLGMSEDDMALILAEAHMRAVQINAAMQIESSKSEETPQILH